MNKKGTFLSGALLVVAIALALIIFNFFSYECFEDNQCKDQQYCGVDHECHDFPDVQEAKQDYVRAALIFGALIGIAIIVAAYILKKKEPPKSFYEPTTFKNE